MKVKSSFRARKKDSKTVKQDTVVRAEKGEKIIDVQLDMKDRVVRITTERRV